jgi:N-acetylneuraminate lyase
MKRHFTGLIAPPYTPMRQDGSLDLGVIEKQAQFLAEGGIRGVFVCGTTGEAMSLTVSERLKVAERWRDVTPEDFPVIVNVGHNCLADSKLLAAGAQRIGADAIAAMAPSFFKPASVEELVSFCGEIAAEAPALPFYYYHIPVMTGVTIPVFDFLRAGTRRIPTLAGAKFTCEDLMDFGRCLTFEGGRFNMLFGVDQMLLAGLALGAEGAVGTTFNLAAPLFQRILKTYETGDMVAARTDQARAVEFIAVVEKSGVFPAGKAIMKMIGMDCGPVRLPLRRLTDEESDRLRDELGRVGFFTYCTGSRGS